jgi:hypothetical protein
MKQIAADLWEAICRWSPLVADNLGLPLNESDLRELYEAIGRHYIKHKATDQFMPTATGLMSVWEQIEYSIGEPCKSCTYKAQCPRLLRVPDDAPCMAVEVKPGSYDVRPSDG